MKPIYLYLIPVIFAAACNNSSHFSKTDVDSQATSHQKKVMDSTVDGFSLIDTVATIIPADNVIEVNVRAENLPVKVQRYIANEMQVIHLVITDLSAGTLRVNLNHSKEDANIRISQIVLPDGTTDGPFGQQLTYNIKQKGDYMLIINKSNMASGSSMGYVFISVER